MAENGSSGRGAWGGKIGFVLAAAGSAVGLGNLWKFPYLAYENGDGGAADPHGAGAFVIMYLVAVVIVGLPVMLSEIMIGRRSGLNPVGAFAKLRPGTPWYIVGALGVSTGFILLSYYAVVAGWTGEYLIKALAGDFNGKSPEEIGSMFDTFLASPVRQVGWLALFMGLSVVVVIGGVSAGIERVTKILMPLLLAMLVGLAVMGLTLEGGTAALTYIFQPDFSVVTPKMVLDALGQAFFSLSLGMGAIITYGSYLSKKEDIVVSGVSIVALDTFVGLIAAVIIFSTLFSVNMSMDSGGVGNLFTAIPVIFQKIPGGEAWVIVFYALVAFAALTSTISLLEVVVAYFIDQKGWSRRKAVTAMGSLIFALGIPSALSFNLGKDFTIAGKTFFEVMDYLCANWALPLGGLFITLFTGWVLTRKEKGEEIGDRPKILALWDFLVRYVAPVAVIAVIIGIVFGLGGEG